MVTALAALLVATATWSVARSLLGLGYLPRSQARSLLRRGEAERMSFQVWLSQAGAAVTPGQFCWVSVAVGSLAFAVLLAVCHAPAICVLPAGAATAAPFAYWSNARRKQAVARISAWPDAGLYLVGVIGSGVCTLHDALEELSRSGPVPLRSPMSRYVRLSSRLGDRRALEVLRSELADPVSDPVLLAFAGAMEEGTETVLRVLSDLGGQITADLQLTEEIHTLQTQSRVANWGCFALPYAMLFLLCTANPSYRSFFSRPIGFLIVAVGMLLSLAGLLVARRLVRPIATSARVFVTAAN